jgi:hypothetical protein
LVPCPAPPSLPQEIKALMQQGVYETPIYNGYMLKGTLEEYEKKVGGDRQ